LKITFILPYFTRKPVGGYKVVYEYANRLSLRGHEVRIVHPYIMPNRYRWFPTYRRNFRRHLGEIRDIILKPTSIPWHEINSDVEMLFPPVLDWRSIPDGDAIIATAWNTAEFVEECPPSKGQKFYLIQHYETWAGPKNRVDATWKSDLHKIVISKWLLDISKEMGLEDVVYIPNGIDHQKYRIKNPIENRPKKVSMMFSQTEWKGGIDGISALLKVNEQFHDFTAIFFGVGPRNREIPSWVEYIRNPPRDYLVDHIYNESIIFICPSWFEGWSLPPAEALACGCAVVSTDCSGIRDYAFNMQTALLSPPKDPEKLAQNVLKLLQNDNLRLRLAKAGHEKILSFNWENSTTMLEDFLHRYVPKD